MEKPPDFEDSSVSSEDVSLAMASEESELPLNRASIPLMAAVTTGIPTEVSAPKRSNSASTRKLVFTRFCITPSWMSAANSYVHAIAAMANMIMNLFMFHSSIMIARTPSRIRTT